MSADAQCLNALNLKSDLLIGKDQYDIKINLYNSQQELNILMLNKNISPFMFRLKDFIFMLHLLLQNVY